MSFCPHQFGAIIAAYVASLGGGVEDGRNDPDLGFVYASYSFGGYPGFAAKAAANPSWNYTYYTDDNVLYNNAFYNTTSGDGNGYQPAYARNGTFESCLGGGFRYAFSQPGARRIAPWTGGAYTGYGLWNDMFTLANDQGNVDSKWQCRLICKPESSANSQVLLDHAQWTLTYNGTANTLVYTHKASATYNITANVANYMVKDVWCQVAVVHDGAGTVTLWVSGNLVGTSATGATFATLVGDDRISIGKTLAGSVSATMLVQSLVVNGNSWNQADFDTWRANYSRVRGATPDEYQTQLDYTNPSDEAYQYWDYARISSASAATVSVDRRTVTFSTGGTCKLEVPHIPNVFDNTINGYSDYVYLEISVGTYDASLSITAGGVALTGLAGTGVVGVTISTTTVQYYINNVAANSGAATNPASVVVAGNAGSVTFVTDPADWTYTPSAIPSSGDLYWSDTKSTNPLRQYVNTGGFLEFDNLASDSNTSGENLIIDGWMLTNGYAGVSSDRQLFGQDTFWFNPGAVVTWDLALEFDTSWGTYNGTALTLLGNAGAFTAEIFFNMRSDWDIGTTSYIMTRGNFRADLNADVPNWAVRAISSGAGQPKTTLELSGWNTSKVQEIASASVNLALDAWHHIAVVKHNEYDMDVYINGVRVIQHTFATQTYYNPGSTEEIKFGIQGYDGTNPQTTCLNGYFAQWRYTHGDSRYTGATFDVSTQGFPIGEYIPGGLFVGIGLPRPVTVTEINNIQVGDVYPGKRYNEWGHTRTLNYRDEVLAMSPKSMLVADIGNARYLREIVPGGGADYDYGSTPTASLTQSMKTEFQDGWVTTSTELSYPYTGTTPYYGVGYTYVCCGVATTAGLTIFQTGHTSGNYSGLAVLIGDGRMNFLIGNNGGQSAANLRHIFCAAPEVTLGPYVLVVRVTGTTFNLSTISADVWWNGVPVTLTPDGEEAGLGSFNDAVFVNGNNYGGRVQFGGAKLAGVGSIGPFAIFDRVLTQQEMDAIAWHRGAVVTESYASQNDLQYCNFESMDFSGSLGPYTLSGSATASGAKFGTSRSTAQTRHSFVYTEADAARVFTPDAGENTVIDFWFWQPASYSNSGKNHLWVVRFNGGTPDGFASPYQYFAGCDVQTNGTIRLLISTNVANNVSTSGGTGNSVDSSTVVNTSAWNHARIEIQGHNTRPTYTVYLNGVAGTPVTLTEGKKAPGGRVNFFTNYSLGTSYPQTTHAYDGYFDNFRISDDIAFNGMSGSFTPPNAFDAKGSTIVNPWGCTDWGGTPVEDATGGDANWDTVMYLIPMDENIPKVYGSAGFYNWVNNGDANGVVLDTSQFKTGNSSLRFYGEGKSSAQTDGLYGRISTNASIPPASLPTFDTVDYTAELWVYPRAYPTNDAELWGTGANTDAYTNTLQCLFFSNGTVNFNFNGAELLRGTTVLTLNTWHHIAFVRDWTNGNVTLYVNGVQDAYLSPHTSAHNINRMTIGATSTQSNFSYGFNGNIDEFRISLMKRYTGNFTPPDTAFPIGNSNASGGNPI